MTDISSTNYSAVSNITPPQYNPARTDTFSQIGSIVGSAAAGGAASFKFSATFSNSLKNTITDVKGAEQGFGNKIKATGPGLKEMGMSTLKGAGIGALVSGAMSAITNGVEVLQGKKTGAEAVGTFAADTASGTVGAMAGVMTGGLATMGLSALLPSLAGTPLLVATIGFGALGAIVADKLFKGSGAYDGIRNAISNSASQG